MAGEGTVGRVSPRFGLRADTLLEESDVGGLNGQS